MRRIALWFLAFGAAAAVVLLVGAIALLAVEPDRLIAPFRAEVRAATGRDLAVRGGARLVLWPEPAVVFFDLSVANAPWGSTPALATARRVEARIALRPLLSLRLEADRLDVTEPAIALETDARGVGNWEPRAAVLPGTTPAAEADAAAAPSGRLSLRDGAVTFRSGRSGTVTRATIDALVFRARDAASPVEVEFRGNVADVAMAATGWIGAWETLRARRWPYPIELAGDIGGRRARIVSKVRAEGDAYVFDELIMGYGSNGFKGRVSIAPGDRRPRVSIFASTRTIRAADLPWVAAAAPPATAGDVQARFLIPAAPLPLAVLDAADIELRLETGAIFFSEGWQVNRVDARIVIEDGRLDTPLLTGTAFDGTVAARLTVEAGRDGAASAALRLDARGVDVGEMLRAFGVRHEIRGAKASIVADLAGRGRSLHEWARSANGEVVLDAGAGTLARKATEPAGAFDRLVDALLPPRAGGSAAELRCAAARLPLAQGVARIERTLAFETVAIGAHASGTLDFGAETIDLAFRSRVLRPVPGSEAVARSARVEGGFAGPAVTMTAARSADAAGPSAMCKTALGRAGPGS